jgi:hypothetical protein
LQRSLQVDTIHLGDQLGAAGAFALALDGVSRDMDQAVASLDRRSTGTETQQAQQNVMRRLDLLLEVLKPEPPENNQSKPNANAGNKTPASANQAAKPPQSIENLAELKLLKMLQEEINRRTADLGETVGPEGKPTDQQRKEYSELAEEQARLAEMILKMQKGN